MIYLNSIEYKMQAMLAEYNTLRTEIQYFNERQNHLLQFHITVLTAIVGLAVTNTISSWIILFIPIESSIFGLWYNNNLLAIMGIGAYIRDNIEKEIRQTLGETHIMRWETSRRKQYILASTKQGINYRHLIILTFGIPSILCLIITIIILILSVLSFHGIFVQGIIDFFNLSNYVNATEKMMIPVFLSIIIDLAFFYIFLVQILSIIKLTENENKKCEENLP